MNKLQAIETFVTIVDRGSLTAAARTLGKSLPSVVRMLSALERSLNVRLLTRSTRRIALTDEGRRYLERCRFILAEFSDADAELADQERPSGQVTLTAPVLFGQMHVVPGVVSYLRHHEKARVDLLLLDRVINLVDEGADLAVRIAHLDNSGLVARRVGHIRRVVCASPSYLQCAGHPVHPRDLERFECLRWRAHDDGQVWRFQDGARPLTIHPQGRLTSNRVAGALNACVAGLGIGNFLSYQIADALADGSLVSVLCEFELPPVPVSLVHTHARLAPLRVRALMDWLANDLATRLSEPAHSARSTIVHAPRNMRPLESPEPRPGI